MLAWFDEDARNYDHAPIDDESRITLRDLIRIKDLQL
jgi:hypothetical protein